MGSQISRQVGAGRWGESQHSLELGIRDLDFSFSSADWYDFGQVA